MTGPAALAEQALAAASETGDEVQATVVRRRTLELAGADGRWRPARRDLTEVRLTVVVEGHAATATTSDVTSDGLAATGAQARSAAEALARAASAPGPHPGVGDAVQPRGHDGLDLPTAALPLARGLDDLAVVTAALEARSLRTRARWTASRTTVAIATSAGRAVADDSTAAALHIQATDPDRGLGHRAATTAIGVGGLDAAAVAARAAAGVARPDPVELEPGAHPAVLSPEAVAALLEALAVLAFDGRAHAEGHGLLAGRLGTRVAASAINLSDSPRFARTLPAAFDVEGTPKAPLPLIQDGVAHAVVHDRASAALTGGGAFSTGHAAAGEHPRPTNLVLIGGGAASEDELVAPITRGVLVGRLVGVRVVDRERGLIATTGTGCALVRDGQRAGPVRDVVIVDAPLRLLQATEALTSATRLVGAARCDALRRPWGTVAPALRAAGLRVVGGS